MIYIRGASRAKRCKPHITIAVTVAAHRHPSPVIWSLLSIGWYVHRPCRFLWLYYHHQSFCPNLGRKKQGQTVHSRHCSNRILLERGIPNRKGETTTLITILRLLGDKAKRVYNCGCGSERWWGWKFFVGVCVLVVGLATKEKETPPT